MNILIISFTVFAMLYHESFLSAAATHESSTCATDTAISLPQFTQYLQLPSEIKRLIADFTGLNTPNKYGWLPLQNSAAHGSYQKTVFLLLCGADANLLNQQHPTTPLSFAASCNYSLCSQQEKRSYSFVSKYLVYHGANPHQINDRGQTALHEAVLSRNIFTLKAFIESNANFNVKNKFGQTPLQLAKAIASGQSYDTDEQQTIIRLCDRASALSAGRN